MAAGSLVESVPLHSALTHTASTSALAHWITSHQQLISPELCHVVPVLCMSSVSVSFQNFLSLPGFLPFSGNHVNACYGTWLCVHIPASGANSTGMGNLTLRHVQHRNGQPHIATCTAQEWHHLMPHLNSEWFYLSVISLLRLSWKRCH